MRRLMFAAIVVVFASLLVVLPARAADRGPCDEERWLRITPQEWTSELVKGLIRCAANRFDVDVSTAMRVADCESSFYAFAHSNGNYGVFQQRGVYWPDRAKALLREDWFNKAQWDRIEDVPQGPYIARANVLLSMKMVRNTGWGDWSCYR